MDRYFTFYFQNSLYTKEHRLPVRLLITEENMLVLDNHNFYNEFTKFNYLLFWELRQKRWVIKKYRFKQMIKWFNLKNFFFYIKNNFGSIFLSHSNYILIYVNK
jgi:hypothetical protein